MSTYNLFLTYSLAVAVLYFSKEFKCSYFSSDYICCLITPKQQIYFYSTSELSYSYLFQRIGCFIFYMLFISLNNCYFLSSSHLVHLFTDIVSFVITPRPSQYYSPVFLLLFQHQLFLYFSLNKRVFLDLPRQRQFRFLPSH